MYYVDGKGHILELKSSRNYLTNHTRAHVVVTYDSPLRHARAH